MVICDVEGEMKKKKYWSSVMAMLGVAMVAASFFAKEGWFLGMILGAYSIYVGARLAEEDK